MNDTMNFFHEIALEEYSDLSVFCDDPVNYLDVTYRQMQFTNKDCIYTETLKTDGLVYSSIIKACNDLTKVNAYQEAILIYTKMISIFEKLKKTASKEDADNLQWSIDEMKSLLMKTIQMRDEYSSKRKAIISRYSELVEKLS